MAKDGKGGEEGFPTPKITVLEVVSKILTSTYCDNHLALLMGEQEEIDRRVIFQAVSPSL